MRVSRKGGEVIVKFIFQEKNPPLFSVFLSISKLSCCSVLFSSRSCPTVCLSQFLLCEECSKTTMSTMLTVQSFFTWKEREGMTLLSLFPGFLSFFSPLFLSSQRLTSSHSSGSSCDVLTVPNFHSVCPLPSYFDVSGDGETYHLLDPSQSLLEIILQQEREEDEKMNKNFPCVRETLILSLLSYHSEYMC